MAGEGWRNRVRTLRSFEKHLREGSADLRPESSQEHLPTDFAGVLRLRAINFPVYDGSATRFAQDDGFVGGSKYNRLDMQKTRKDRRSYRLS
jgi:hypothetical protein